MPRHGDPIGAATDAGPQRDGAEDDGRPLVLVAEPDAVLSGLLERLLGRLGCATICVAEGAGVLQRVTDPADRSLAMVLLSNALPDSDVLCLTRAIRLAEQGRAPRLPVVWSTTDDSAPARVEALAAGADDFLVQPITFMDVERVLTTWKMTPLPAAPATHVELDGVAVLDDRMLAMYLPVDQDDLEGLDVVAQWSEEAPESVAIVRAAVVAGDATAMGERAHRFKGSAAVIGVPRVARVCAALERLGDGGRVDGTADLVALLEVEVACARRALHVWRARLAL